MTLQCNNSQRIQVITVIDGLSSEECRNQSRCCPSTFIYSGQETTYSKKYLKDKCDGEQRCDIRMETFTYDYTTDYASVDYLCRNDPFGKHPLCWTLDREHVITIHDGSGDIFCHRSVSDWLLKR